MITHDLTRTGAPLLLLEAARALIDRGAIVRVASASNDLARSELASRFRVPLIPIETAITAAASADVIIANTMSPHTKWWVKTCLAANPALAQRLVWWIHEIDVEVYRRDAELVAEAAAAIFDSEATRAAWAAAIPLPRHVRVVNLALSDTLFFKSSAKALPFPTDPDRFLSRGNAPLTRAEIRERLGVSPQDFLLSCIGTIEPRKGQRMLVRTVAALAQERQLPLKLVLVGLAGSSERQEFLAGLTPQEARVLSPARAYVLQEDFEAFYLASDAYVMNSQGSAHGRGESFGRVTVEAMAFGLPVLGTGAGGTLDIVIDEVTGLLFPTGEEGQSVLGKHIERIMADPTLARRLGDAGRARARERFQHGRFLREFAEILTFVQ